jgi:hypothetical protein
VAGRLARTSSFGFAPNRTETHPELSESCQENHFHPCAYERRDTFGFRSRDESATRCPEWSFWGGAIGGGLGGGSYGLNVLICKSALPLAAKVVLVAPTGRPRLASGP